MNGVSFTMRLNSEIRRKRVTESYLKGSVEAEDILITITPHYSNGGEGAEDKQTF